MGSTFGSGRIRVERRRVDRPLTGTPGHVFEEQTIELTESAEEPVVQKQARVVEEVTIGKDVHEREETIRDKALRTDVEVERSGVPLRPWNLSSASIARGPL